jgi:hypothetical protein
MAKNIKKAIRKAGNKISNKELQKIVKKSGGSTSKALDKISSVQQSRKDAGKTAPSLGSKAANNLIKQAQSTPAGVYQLGSSKIAQSVRGMAGTPAGPMIQGKQQPGTPTAGLGYVPGGMTIRPSGRLGVGPKKDNNKTKNKNKGGMPGPYDGMQIGQPDLGGPGPLADPNTETWLGNQDPGNAAGDPTITDDTNVTEETNALPGIGMMSGGGMGATGANKLGRAKSRLRKLGIYGRGTGLLGRGLQYGNSLNA